MRVRLKGINSERKRLANGSYRTYWYAWKGGPALRGEPGTPEFIASYNEAVATKVAPRTGTLLTLLFRFQESAEFQFGISPRTRRDYIKQIERIEREFGDFPIRGLDDQRATSIFLEWRDRLAQTSLRQADYAYGTLARILSWALKRRLIETNPCANGGKLYQGTRVDKIWTDDDVSRFLRAAPPYLKLAMMLAVYTGQRQGDLLRLPWSAYDGTVIKMRQRKTGAYVGVPVADALKTALNSAPKRCPIMLTSSEGKPWTESGFQSAWGKATMRAGVRGLTFHGVGSGLLGFGLGRLGTSTCCDSVRLLARGRWFLLFMFRRLNTAGTLPTSLGLRSEGSVVLIGARAPLQQAIDPGGRLADCVGDLPLSGTLPLGRRYILGGGMQRIFAGLYGLFRPAQ